MLLVVVVVWMVGAATTTMRKKTEHEDRASSRDTACLRVCQSPGRVLPLKQYYYTT